MGCNFLLQGIVLTQGSNPGLTDCRQTLYCLSHQGSPKRLTGYKLRGFFFFLIKFFFLYFLSVLGLHCCTRAFSSCSNRGLLSSCGAWAPHCDGFSSCGGQAWRQEGFSSCSKWTLEHVGFSSYGARAWLPCRVWNFPRPGIEPVLPCNGRCTLNQLPGKSSELIFTLNSVPLVYMSILMTVQDCLDYSNFVISFEITKYRLPTIFFFKTKQSISRQNRLFWVPSISMWILGLACQFLQNKQLTFGKGLYWICRSI